MRAIFTSVTVKEILTQLFGPVFGDISDQMEA